MIDTGRLRRPPKAAFLVAQQIVHEVVKDKLQPGEILPVERVMLQRYHVGRSTLREALRLLEVHGLIMLVPGPRQGPVLCDPDATHLIDTLELLMGMTRTPFDMVTDMRLSIEPMVSGMAAQRIGDELLGDLAASVDQMRERLGETAPFFASGQRFHGLIASSTGNILLRYIVDSLVGMEMSVAARYDLQQQGLVVDAHEKILDALAAGDPSSSRSRMHAHLEECKDFGREPANERPFSAP